MDKTLSEELFERFCRKRGLDPRRIEESQEKTPDYRVALLTVEAIVEVKEFNPNRRELEALKQRDSIGEVVFDTFPGDRLREKIKESDRQLRKCCNDVHPGVLIVYDNIGLPTGLTKPFNIRTSMYGTETLEFRAEHPASGVHEVERFHGDNKGVRFDKRTSVSALAVMTQPGAEITLDVYHNVHAAAPLEPNELRGEGIRHFELKNLDWIEL